MHQALYRKWRPKTFDEVYGQPHITRTLKNQVATGRISHAYLFTGSRGTGKTTCAKILAKAVNCLDPVDGNPCNECEICKAIDSGSALDIAEIDAASNNSVNDIRDLREEVNFTPALTKYRVYIIDEVHMLTSGAFNALLKTLEEPPEHVIFILATTELHKVIATILSRCQRFDFNRISPEEIVKRLEFVAEEEGVTINEEGANLIANLSDGSLRDALSILDRCLSVTSEVDENVVSSVAGITSNKHLFAFSDCIVRKDYKTALELVNELHRGFSDIDRICVRLCEHFRNLMVASCVKNSEGLIVCSKSELEKYKQEATRFKLSKIVECINIITQTAAVIRTAPNKRIQFEAAVIKMCSADTSSEEFSPDIEQRLSALEEKLASGSFSAQEPKAEPEKQYNPFLDSPPEEEREEETQENTPLKEFTQETAEEKEETEDMPSVQDSLQDIIKPLVEAAQQEEKQKVQEPKQAEPVVPSFSSLPDGPFTEWPDVLEVLTRYDMPLYGLLFETTASIKGDRVIIKTTNSSLVDFISGENKVHYVDLVRSIYEVTGLKMKIVVNCVKEKEEFEGKSPLELLLDKVNDFNNEGE